MNLVDKKLPRYEFRLFVAGDAINSAQAIILQSICKAHLPDRQDIEIVDVLRDPSRALTDGVLLTPTLIKLGPLPTRRMVGTLSQRQVVLETLGLVDIAG